jgi:hypothetical protein
MAEDDDELLFPALDTLGDFLADLPWPTTFFSTSDLPGFLDQVTILSYEANAQPGAESVRVWLAFPGEIVLDVPGLDGVHLVIGGELGTTTTSASTSSPPALPPGANDVGDGAGDGLDDIPPDDPDPTDDTFLEDDSIEEPDAPDLTGLSFIQVEFFLGTDPSLRFSNITIALRFDSDILAPADPSGGPVEIVANGSIAVDSTFNVTVDGFDSLSLKQAIIGSSGIGISADGVAIDLSRTSSSAAVLAAGFDSSFMGVFIGNATLTLPAGMLGSSPEQITLTNAAIGSGGVSGTAALAHKDPVFDSVEKVYNGDRAATLFGVPFWLSDLSLTLKANAFVNATINGEIVMPFFQQRIAVQIGFDGNGGLLVQIAGTPGNPLVSFNPVTGVTFQVLSLGVAEQDGKGLFKLNTKLVLQNVGGIGNWPSPEVDGLLIDSDGNVKIEGGWIDLPKQASLDIDGFKMELTKIGFGKDDDASGGHRWFGFSGALKLVDGIKAGASVKGLRISLTEPPDFSLDGVGVDFEIPNSLSVTGSV